MFRCPYCNAQMAHPTPDEMPMSPKRRWIYEFIAAGGPRGVKKQDLIDKFFSKNTSETILRTTIFHINSIIKPQRITTKGGFVCLRIDTD